MSPSSQATGGKVGCVVVKLGTRLITTGPNQVDLQRLGKIPLPFVMSSLEAFTAFGNLGFIDTYPL